MLLRGIMPLLSSNQHGAIYKFGVTSADAPAVAGFKCREAELKYAPEVKEEAQDGEGHADSVTVSKPGKRMINGTFTGNVDETWDPNSLTDSFNFLGRFYVIDDISEPRKKGKYWEVTITATSKANITN